MNKTQSSIRNFIFAILSNVTSIVVGIVAQRIFIKLLGIEYLGLNGLFTNIISILGIVELGIGSAIIYNLYKPIQEKNEELIKSLMKFYKKAYNIIAIVVLSIGMLLIPFLTAFVGTITVDVNIYAVYSLFIIDIVCSYLLSYKRSILYADQKNFIINIVHMIYYVILNLLQLMVLYYSQNYYLYLFIKIVMRILENVVITIYVNKNYKYLVDGKEVKTLDKKIEKDIFKKVKALFFHQIGSFIVNGTDNLIISRFLGVAIVGLYSNYFMIINAVNGLFGQAIIALTPSVGHMLVEDNKEKFFDIFKKIRFMNFWIACFSASAILISMQPFICIWLGEEYLLSNAVLYVLVFNFFQNMMRYSYIAFKEAAGIYYEDRIVPIIESILNITISIILVNKIGLIGVFIGTIISGMALWCYSYPKFVYKKLFGRKYIQYIKETLGYILLFIIIGCMTLIIESFLKIDSYFLKVAINLAISCILPNLLLLIIFSKTENFKYLISIILRKKSIK